MTTINSFFACKNRAYIMKQLFSPVVWLLALACSGAAWAERADRDKPMHIEADALRHDELKQVSIFSGNVVMTKGSIVLRGGELQVRQDPQGYQYGVIKAAAGQRAFFRQKRDTRPGAPQEHVEGEAEQIEYDGRKDDVRLLRRAQLRRYADGRLNDDITGSTITYNNITDVFTVDGGARSTAPGSKNGGRVRAVLSPKAGPAAPAADPAPATVLQPSLELQPQDD